MFQVISYVQKKLEIDQAIIWSSLNKGFGFIKAPFSVYFILKYLTVADQGLWYTFGSLGALTVFAELGFTTIITQFVSHEFAKLSYVDGYVSGEKLHEDRLFGLIKFSVRFYVGVILIALLILSVIGYFYFRTEAKSVLIAWFFFSIVGALALLVNLFQSIFQGFDKVKEIQINALFCAVITTAANWTMLAMHWKIWALIIGNLTGLVVTSILLYKVSPNFWRQAFRYKEETKFNFLRETGPLQLKYAISWISGYFIFNLYVPATYKFIGQAEAGQLGITISVITVIVSISGNWINTKIPKFNILVASRALGELDSLFKKSFLNSFKIQIVFSLGLISGLYLLNILLPNVSARFLNVSVTSLILLSQLAMSIISSLALYLRSHKEEPFVWISVLNAVLIISSIFFILSNYRLSIFFVSINVIYWFVLLPISIRTFIKYRKLYKIKYYNFE